MKRLHSCRVAASVCVVFVISCLLTRAQQEDKPAPGPLTFLVRLTDGSRLMGELLLDKLPIKTSYADIGIEPAILSIVSFDHARTNATLKLNNGDQVQGVVGLERIEINSLIGKIALPLNIVEEISRVVPEPEALPDTPEARNACINNLRMIDGAKDQYTLEFGGRNGGVVTWENVSPYIRADRLKEMMCPLATGTNKTYRNSYRLNPVGTSPECAIHKNHRL